MSESIEAKHRVYDTVRDELYFWLKGKCFGQEVDNIARQVIEAIEHAKRGK